MSAIASFISIPVTALQELIAAPDPRSVLRQHGREAAQYRWSGYVLATLLPYLDERNIALMKCEHGDLASQLSKKFRITCFILTHSQKEKFSSQLSADSYSETELRDYFNNFNATEESEIGKAMLDGIRSLKQALDSLDEKSVIVFVIA